MEHESALVLETGPDRRIGMFALWSTAAGMAAFALSPAGLILNISGALVCLLAYFCLWRPSRTAQPGQLLLFPDGRVRWRGPDNRWHEAVIAAHAWSSGCYAVLTGLSGCKARRFLISRSRQQAGNYRILMAWLRLKSTQAHWTMCNGNRTGSG